ncbi:MAG: hypothetical protein KGJ02_07305 [Verrucomicrobiota bacterium]|nr:hypothetical protein [Verrucomicrobiota bacterium]
MSALPISQTLPPRKDLLQYFEQEIAQIKPDIERLTQELERENSELDKLVALVAPSIFKRLGWAFSDVTVEQEEPDPNASKIWLSKLIDHHLAILDLSPKLSDISLKCQEVFLFYAVSRNKIRAQLKNPPGHSSYALQFLVDRASLSTLTNTMAKEAANNKEKINELTTLLFVQATRFYSSLNTLLEKQPIAEDAYPSLSQQVPLKKLIVYEDTGVVFNLAAYPSACKALNHYAQASHVEIRVDHGTADASIQTESAYQQTFDAAQKELEDNFNEVKRLIEEAEKEPLRLPLERNSQSS